MPVPTVGRRIRNQANRTERGWLCLVPIRGWQRRCGVELLSTSRGSGWIVVAALLLLSGCRTLPRNDLSQMIRPSNYRDWSPEFAVVPTAEFQTVAQASVTDEDSPGHPHQLVTIHHVRNSQYVTETDYVLEYESRTYDLADLRTVDFLVVPFQGTPAIAHTMLSFGFTGDRYLCVSAEIRTEKGETYSGPGGLTRQFELTYVVADERDLIRLRTRHRNAEVYLYRTTATPAKARELFVDVLNRVNELAERPEFYDLVSNNCTTNIFRHVRRIADRRIPFTMGVLLPGYSDRDAYDLGLLDRSLPFAELKRKARINDLADAYYDDPDFSVKIRRRIDAPRRFESETAGDLGERDSSIQVEEGERVLVPPAAPPSSSGGVVRASYEEEEPAERQDRRASRVKQPKSRSGFDFGGWSVRDR